MPVAALLVALLATACGSSSSPTIPTPPVVTVSGLTLSSSSDMMKIGTNETFTLTASRTDGSTVAVSGATWNSDNPAVAVVNANGLVSPIGSGTATIFVDYQGRRATKLIRVVPDLQGRWAGTWTKLACSELGNSNTCSQVSSGGLDITLTQTRDTLSGQVTIGTAPVTVGGTISQGGTATLTGQGTISGVQTNITAWTTVTSGTVMTGQFTFVASVLSQPIVVTVTAGLSGVTKR